MLFFGLYFGRTLIFPWVTHPIAQKAAWLNTPFLFARDGIGLGVMTAPELRVDAAVAHQRRPPNGSAIPKAFVLLPHPIRRIAPAVAICFAIVYTLISFDLVMSLAPAWRSTLFGWYFFAGAFWSGRRRDGAGRGDHAWTARRQ